MLKKLNIIVVGCGILGAYKMHQQRAKSFPNRGFLGYYDQENTLYINNQLRQGEDLEKDGRIEDAYHIYEDLVTKYPNSKPCKAHFGHCAVKLNESQNRPAIISP